MIDITPIPIKLTPIRIGTGKKQAHVFNVKSMLGFYDLIHVPTDCWIVRNYLYLSTARFCANVMIEQLERDVLLLTDRVTLSASVPLSLVDYLKFWSTKDVKKPIEYEEWLNGTDYEEINRERTHSAILKQQEEEYGRELSAGDISIGWVPRRT